MGKQYDHINESIADFIANQKMFFVATATADSRINLSPKGLDSLRVLSPNRVIWLNLTGSGNETAAHLLDCNRMTLMFNAFEGKPMILRLYGTATAIHNKDEPWESLLSHFSETTGARQIFDMHVEMVQASCGMAVPLYQYQGQRDQLVHWAHKQGDQGIHQYWHEKNQTSIDGLETGIMNRVKESPNS